MCGEKLDVDKIVKSCFSELKIKEFNWLFY